jgi:hypothetical protein
MKNKKGLLQKIIDKIFTKKFEEEKILDKDLSVKKKVYKTLLRYAPKKIIDNLFFDIIKKYEKRIEDYEEDEAKENKKIEAKEKNIYDRFVIFSLEAEKILKQSDKSLLNEFLSDVQNVQINKKGQQNSQDVKLVMSKWKKEILNIKAKNREGFIENIQKGTLLKQQLEMAIRYEEIQNIKEEAKEEIKKTGEKKLYRWLPSSAMNPDPEHEKLYGKIFEIGTGDSQGNMPGERYGCQCDLEIIN